MSAARFIVARAAGGSVILKDTAKARLAVIFPRDCTLPDDRAEAAAQRMAELCAEVLNRAHQVALAKKGGA